MKRNLMFGVLILFIATVGFGQNLKAQFDALNQEAAPYLAQREANKKTLATLTQTGQDIQMGDDALGKGAAKFKDARAAYDIDLGAYTPAAAELNSALNAHNANRCQKTQYDNCSAYEAEASQLNSRRDYLQGVKNGLDSRKSTLDATLGSLLELQKIMEAKEEKYAADVKAYNAQNEENEAKIDSIAKRWNALKNQLQPCLDKLPPNPTNEMMHEVCGQLWDGNSIHAEPVNQGTGGITPNK